MKTISLGDGESKDMAGQKDSWGHARPLAAILNPKEENWIRSQNILTCKFNVKENKKLSNVRNDYIFLLEERAWLRRVCSRIQTHESLKVAWTSFLRWGAWFSSSVLKMFYYMPRKWFCINWSFQGHKILTKIPKKKKKKPTSSRTICEEWLKQPSSGRVLFSPVGYNQERLRSSQIHTKV